MIELIQLCHVSSYYYLGTNQIENTISNSSYIILYLSVAVERCS
jgi:hypothetical protein